MPQQVGDPLAILHVRLPSGDRLHMLRVHQQDGPPVLLEQVVDRSPVDPSRLHSEVRDAGAAEPVGQRQQISGHRAEGADPPPHRPVRPREQHARDHAPFVDVDPATSRMDHLHRRLLSALWPARGRVLTTFSHVLIPTRMATLGAPGRPPASILCSGSGTSSLRPASADHGDEPTAFSCPVLPRRGIEHPAKSGGLLRAGDPHILGLLVRRWRRGRGDPSG